MSDVPPTSDGSAGAPRPGRPEFRHAKPPPRRRRAVKGIGVLVVLALVAVVGVVGYGWWRYNQIGREDLALAESVGTAQNFLIVGSDTRAVVDPKEPDVKAFGHEDSGQRSDTIMIARVDPKAKTVDLMSFPRDLWVPIEPSGEPQRINTAYNTTGAQGAGAQRLVDTIKADFGIDINHYVEIDFASFKGVVDAVGGIPLYFRTAVRDTNTGFYQTELGCQTLDGTQSLALSRSRHLQYQNKKGVWVDDPSSDLGRIARQQLVMRKMVDRSSAKFGSFDLKAMNDIVSSTSDKLKLDDKLSLGDLASLGKAFKGFAGDQIVSHTLPVYPETTNGGAAVLKLDSAAAEDVLNIFRGLPAGTVSPASVTLAVSNGSGAKNQATEVANRLRALGYTASIGADTAKVQAKTVVRYAPGLRAQADQVARQLATGAELQEDTSLKGAKATVVLVTGTDFTGVLDQATAPTSAPPGTNTSSTAASAADTVTTVDAGEVVDAVGYVAFEPPDGTTCG
jgi:polyisoprenyl-teichoic acid--peptidoglycan teichoic acid transferase